MVCAVQRCILSFKITCSDFNHQWTILDQTLHFARFLFLSSGLPSWIKPNVLILTHSKRLSLSVPRKQTAHTHTHTHTHTAKPLDAVDAAQQHQRSLKRRSLERLFLTWSFITWLITTLLISCYDHWETQMKDKDRQGRKACDFWPNKVPECFKKLTNTGSYMS